MAAINWNQIKQTVEESKDSSENVAKYEHDCKEIMADGNEYTIKELRRILIAGYNADLAEGADRIDVNWSTLKYALTHKSGFREVEGKQNTFVLDENVKRIAKPKGRKINK